MNKKILLPITIVCLVLAIIFAWMFFLNNTSSKLKRLYINPTKVNQIYDNYTYDEYNDHVTILSYNGNEKEVIIPERINNKPVYSIDDSAFYANPNLEKVSVPSQVIRIGHQTFIGNANLKEVILPNNLVDIGRWAFEGCPKLEKIYVKKDSKTEQTLNKLPFKEYITYK